MTQKGLILSNDDFNSLGKIDNKQSYSEYTSEQRKFQTVIEQDLLLSGIKDIKNYFSKQKPVNDEETQKKQDNYLNNKNKRKASN